MDKRRIGKLKIDSRNREDKGKHTKRDEMIGEQTSKRVERKREEKDSEGKGEKKKRWE